MCFVAEINPGLGLITRALLEAGVPFVYMYETSFSFHNRLRSLSKEFPNRTELRCTNLLQIDKILFIDESYQKKADKALKDIPSNKWENDTCIQLVCTLGNVSSIRNIILTTIYQSSYTKYGRPVFYAIIKPEVWNLYTNEKKRKWNVESAMFHILFDYKEYGKVSRKSFLPWEYIDPKKDKSDELCVVKIEAKANLFSKHKNKDEIMNIWHFMKYCYGVRNSRFIIPEFEKMIPGCGIKLIARNYNIFTQFQDLSIEELHEIFEEFKSEPAFIQNLEPTSLVLHNEK
ncbi:hypothetical protein KM043_000577 [Ampulex compressa]|nr:hypothetical protein KM043_000577 [Ampulex compressa]